MDLLEAYKEHILSGFKLGIYNKEEIQYKLVKYGIVVYDPKRIMAEMENKFDTYTVDIDGVATTFPGELKKIGEDMYHIDGTLWALTPTRVTLCPPVVTTHPEWITTVYPPAEHIDISYDISTHSNGQSTNSDHTEYNPQGTSSGISYGVDLGTISGEGIITSGYIQAQAITPMRIGRNYVEYSEEAIRNGVLSLNANGIVVRNDTGDEIMRLDPTGNLTVAGSITSMEINHE